MLKEFLVKAAYTPWVRNDKPEITNSDSSFASASQDALSKLKFDAQLNAIKRTDPEQYEYLMNLPSSIYTDEEFMNPAQKNLARLERDQVARQYNSGKSIGLPFMPEVTIDSPKIPQEIENYAQALQQLPQAKARLNDSIGTSANALLNRINPNYSVKPPFAGIKPAAPKLDPTAVQVSLPKAVKNTTIAPTNIDSLVANADLNGIQLASSPASAAGTVALDSLADFNPNASLQDGTYLPPVKAPAISTEQADTQQTPAPASPSLPNSASTAGGDSGLQAPTIDIPEFNASTQSVQPPLAPNTTPAPAQPIKAPAISTEQARQLLSRGYTPTSIGGYSQVIGSDGTNPMAAKYIARMDVDPSYNPFANTKSKYVDKLQGALVDPSTDPKVIQQQAATARAMQAKRDEDRRTRMQAAKQLATQGNTGAADYLAYMQSGKPMTAAGQQFNDTFDTAAYRQQQAQAAKPQQTQWKSALDGPRDPGEQAYMRSVLGYADTGSGVGSHAAGRAWAAKNNSENGLSASAVKPVKNPLGK